MKDLLGIVFVLAFLFVPLTYTQQRQLTLEDSTSGKRVALVIGNSAYPTAPLKNPVNDAQDMAQALRRLGFDVIYRENLNQNEMKRAIREFGAKIRNGNVGLFYYAGHGVAVKGINYLVPVDAKVESEEEVEYECVDAGFVLAQMESAGNSMNIAIFDACRNNPFARSFRSASRGLVQMDAPSGTLIAYATAPGSVASDGNARNGLYTQELLRFVQTPNLGIEEVFKQVRISVRNLTQGRQTPWESSSLIGDFYFTGARESANSGSLQTAAPSGASSSNNTSELSPEEARKEAVAATVNGKRITLTEVDRSVSQQSGGQQSQLSGPQLSQARMQVLSNLIDQEVLFQRAKKEGLVPSEDEVTQAVNTQKTQSGMNEEEFQKRLKEQSLTNDSLREEARKGLAIQKLQDKNNSKIGSPTDKEIADFYNANKEQFVSARVGLSMIVADPADNGLSDDAKSDAEAKSKLDDIYLQLKNGADFSKLARARSEDTNSRVRGGDIGLATEDDLKQNAFPKNLIRDFFGSMQVGNVTSPVNFNGRRWYIFKLIKKQLQNENLTVDSPGVRQQISEDFINQRKQIANAALLEKAKNEARIVNYLASAINENPRNLQ